MTKINHNRSSLRYIDNLRRELRRENRPAPTWFRPERVKANAIVIDEPENFPTYVHSFSKLAKKQQSIMSEVIENFGAYQDASIEVMKLIMAKKTNSISRQRKTAKLAQDDAYEKLVVSGALLISEIIEDRKNDIEGVWDWFTKFFQSLDRQTKFAWLDLQDILFEVSMPLYFARMLADSPDEADRLRKYLTVEDWQ